MPAPIAPTPGPDARRRALAGLLDDAAAGSAGPALAAHRMSRAGDHAALLGRLCLPAEALEDAAAALTASLRAGEPTWGIAAIVPRRSEWVEAATTCAARIERVVGEMAPAAPIDVVEIGVPPEAPALRDRFAGGLAAVLAALEPAGSPTPYLHLPWIELGTFAAALDVIAETSTRHRRGIGVGVEAGARPEGVAGPHPLAWSIDACRQRSLPMRVSGLRHPIARTGSGGTRWHGVLNVLTAAALSFDRAAPVAALERVLAEERPDRFAFAGRHLDWSGVRIHGSDLAAMRDRLLTAMPVSSFEATAADLSRW